MFENMDKRISDLLKAYEYGIDYGLLISEQERDSEGLFDAAGCAVYSRKMCLPSATAPRRQPRSAEWREAMASSFEKFIKLISEEM